MTKFTPEQEADIERMKADLAASASRLNVKQKVNSEMLAALIVCSDGYNTLMDNWRWWSPEQMLKHMRDLQTVACDAIAAARAAGIGEDK